MPELITLLDEHGDRTAAPEWDRWIDDLVGRRHTGGASRGSGFQRSGHAD